MLPKYLGWYSIFFWDEFYLHMVLIKQFVRAVSHRLSDYLNIIMCMSFKTSWLLPSSTNYLIVKWPVMAISSLQTGSLVTGVYSSSGLLQNILRSQSLLIYNVGSCGCTCVELYMVLSRRSGRGLP